MIIYLAMIICAAVMIGASLSALSGVASPGGFGIGVIVSAVIVFGLAIWLLVMFCTNGDVGENKYGPDPKADGSEDISQIGVE